MTERIATLPAIRDALWGELAAAALDKAHAWHTPVLATTDGTLADARTVVLREVDAETKQLRFYTDGRTAKVAQLRRQPVGTLLLWSPQIGWQLRCRVRLELEPSGLATSSRWARVKLSPAVQDYLSPLAPGTAIASPASPAASVRDATVTRDHFAVVTAHVQAVDWLELHPLGHRRARFDAGGATWLQP